MPYRRTGPRGIAALQSMLAAPLDRVADDASRRAIEGADVSARTDTPQPTSRRARRAADRQRATNAARRPRRQGQRQRSPLLWLTVIAGVAAVGLIGALVLLQGGAAVADAGAPVAPRGVTPTSLAEGRTLGRADAPVTLEVWSDFQCPACGQFARVVEPELVRDFVVAGTLRIVNHDAAFQGQRAAAAYDESVEAGAAARCALAQDRYWPLHDWLFANQSGENQGAFEAARLRALAGSAGLDLTAWDACLASGTEQAAVRAETQQAVAAGVAATPTMILDGQTIVGLRSAAELAALIRAAAAGS